LPFLGLCHDAYDVSRGGLPEGLEALVDAVPGTRPGNNEFHFRKIRQRTVVNVGDELVRQKVANHRVRPQEPEPLVHRLTPLQLSWYAVPHHAFDQAQMVTMLSGIAASPAGGHDVCGGINALTGRHRVAQHSVIAAEIVCCEPDLA